MKEIEKKMLSELVRNARRSDRELAKAIGTSQPTATRVRTKLEKEGYVREYTTIPNFSKIGYSILAVNFLKLDLRLVQDRKSLENFKPKHYSVLANNSGSAVVLINRGMGLGYDAVIVSLHQDYAGCDKFRDIIKEQMHAIITDLNTFLVNLNEEKASLPFSFALLANQIPLLSGNGETGEKR